MPLTNQQKQERYRARKRQENLQEVRGIYLPKELHKALKDYAKTLTPK